MATLLYMTLQLLANLPRPLLQWLGRLLGQLHFLINTRSARVTQTNIKLCFPDMPAADRRQLVKASLKATGMTLFETPAVWLGKASRLQGWITEVHNESLLLEALAADKGVIILLPHMGNWELFNFYFKRYADDHGPMTALYHPPKQAVMDGMVRQVRQQHGNQVVATDSAGLRRLYATLKAGGTVVVLPDQVPARGDLAPFFGQPALTDTLIPRLAARSGAKIISSAVIRNPDGRFAVHLDQAGQQGLITLALINQLVEQAVSLAPAQYQWEYKRFKQRGDDVYSST